MILCTTAIFMMLGKCDPKLPWCSPKQSGSGRWVNSSLFLEAAQNLSDFQRYYVGLSYKNALAFSQVWIPSSECSIHRFTKATIRRAIHSQLSLFKPKQAPIRQNPHVEAIRSVTWMFAGDSALRGIFCGIVHVLEGSEVHGPCINTVCGGLKDSSGSISGVVSTHVMNQVFEMNYFDRRLILKFVYVKTFHVNPMVRFLLHNEVRLLRKGDVLIQNSGKTL